MGMAILPLRGRLAYTRQRVLEISAREMAYLWAKGLLGLSREIPFRNSILGFLVIMEFLKCAASLWAVLPLIVLLTRYSHL